MKTLTKTKLAVKTAVGIALIGGFALAAGGFGYKIYKKYNPILPIQPSQQNQTVTAEPSFYGNFAGKNVTDVEARCQKLAYDNYETARQFIATGEKSSYDASDRKYGNDFVCFAKQSDGSNLYVGAAQSWATQSYATPQGVTNAKYNTNGANNFCCDIKKYYSGAEVTNCRRLTEDNFGRLTGQALTCANKKQKGIAFNAQDRSFESCVPNIPEHDNTSIICSIGVRSCGFWAQLNNRGRAGFDLCSSKQYSKVCISPAGEYVGCQKQGSNKCVNIDIYNNTTVTVDQPASAVVCNTGIKDGTGKSCQYWVNDINSVAGKKANSAKKNCAATGYSRVCVDKFSGEATGCANKATGQCYNVDFNTGEIKGTAAEQYLNNAANNSDLDLCDTGVADKPVGDSFCDPLFKKQAYLAKAQACISRSTGSEEFYGLCLNGSLGGTVYNAGEGGCLSNLNSESCAAAGGHTCWLKDFATGEYKYGLMR